jgi:hypothetical protein
MRGGCPPPPPPHFGSKPSYAVPHTRQCLIRVQPRLTLGPHRMPRPSESFQPIARPPIHPPEGHPQNKSFKKTSRSRDAWPPCSWRSMWGWNAWWCARRRRAGGQEHVGGVISDAAQPPIQPSGVGVVGGRLWLTEAWLMTRALSVARQKLLHSSCPPSIPTSTGLPGSPPSKRPLPLQK